MPCCLRRAVERLGTRYGTPNAQLARSQCIDEEVHGRAGADADDGVLVGRRRVPLRRRAASSICVHVRAPRCVRAREMPVFPGSGNDCARFRGHSLHHINKKRFYFFLAAFFLPPFFFADFFALVAIVINLHVELVRAQYIHKLKIASKRCVRICCASSHHSSHVDDHMRSLRATSMKSHSRLRHRRDRQSIAALRARSCPSACRSHACAARRA